MMVVNRNTESAQYVLHHVWEDDAARNVHHLDARDAIRSRRTDIEQQNWFALRQCVF
jgi:hypothetical protein